MESESSQENISNSAKDIYALHGGNKTGSRLEAVVRRIMKASGYKIILSVVTAFAVLFVASFLGAYAATKQNEQDATIQLPNAEYTNYEKAGTNTTGGDCASSPLYELMGETGVCFRIILFLEEKTWVEARQRCRDDGAHLMTIENMEQFNVIQSRLINLGRTSATDDYTAIDGNDFEAGTSDGRWVDWKGNPLSWTHFRSNINNLGRDGNCLVLWPPDPTDLVMGDYPCDDHWMWAAVCQK